MAGLTNFTPINTSDRTLQLIQNELQRAIGQLVNNPLPTGVLKQVSFSKVDTDIIVPHYLGTTNVSWLVGGMNFPAYIFASPKTKGNANQIVLQCETPVTAISQSDPLTAYVYAFIVS
jgi:hypothetical protein